MECLKKENTQYGLSIRLDPNKKRVGKMCKPVLSSRTSCTDKKRQVLDLCCPIMQLLSILNMPSETEELHSNVTYL